MRKIAVLSFVTLDGVMQAPGGPDEDPSGNFKHGGWSVGYWDDVMGKVMAEQMGHSFDLLLGRKTYEIFAAYWPKAKDVPGAHGLNKARKYVVSKTPRKLDWNNSVLVTRNIPEEIKKLKRQDVRELQVQGSPNLLQNLQRHEIWHEYLLKRY